jgi:glycosyltransferase involved in cell wall biosynthesis
MSEGQRERYLDRFPQLREKSSIVLSSVFHDEFLNRVKARKEKKRSGWIVLGSESWIKGASDAIKWCQDNKKDYEVCWNLPYEQLLDKLESAEGFVYLPLGGDTCPRMVIEAKLLGCQVVTNDNVQHSSEEWWQSSPNSICDYLAGRPSIFWSKITSFIQHQPTLSGYSTTYNCVTQNYPFVESITSMLDVCDEVCVVDSGSDDGTLEVLQEMAASEPRLKLKVNKIDMSQKRYAVKSDGAQKAVARDMCTGEFCWQQDIDEVIHEKDYKKIRDLVKNIPKGVFLVCLPVVEFWGKKGKIRIDINPWKWRLSRNHPDITHGIPANLRAYDQNGELYAQRGTDSCDYITKSTGEYVPYVNFHTAQTESLRQAAQADSQAREKYVEWFSASVENLPTAYHYSWFDLPRKIRTYKTFWSRFWQSLYNVEQDDTPENNMFFDKKWADVSDDEIESLSTRLERDMGGWIFHRKIDWNKPTPSVMINSVVHPEVMSDWIASEEE